MADLEIESTPVVYAADDRIIALRGSGSGVPITIDPSGADWAAAMRDALATLTSTNRLSATAIKDLPAYKEPIWGSGAPTAGIGKDGDTYIDGSGGAIYGPKAAGVWPGTPVPLGGGDVTSVNGNTGAVVLGKADVGLGQVNNTADINKPISVAMQAALDGKTSNGHNHALAGISGLGATGLELAESATAEDALEALGYLDVPAEWEAGFLRIVDDGSGNLITSVTGPNIGVEDGGTGASTAADARTNLGLGSIATQAASAVAITGGTVTGITDLTVADGGTGASTAAGAVQNLIVGMASVSLTDGATITPNFANGRNFHVTLAGNRTLANPTNQVAGQSGRILVTQDGTGSRTLAYGANWRFPGGAPTLSTGAGDIDMITYDVHASGTIYATLIKDFTA